MVEHIGHAGDIGRVPCTDILIKILSRSEKAEDMSVTSETFQSLMCP